MMPTLADGEFVLVDTSDRPQAGDLALATHPDNDVMVVKRVTEQLADGRFVVMSDNPEGSDSRTWGPLGAERVRGRVTLILDRPLAPLSAPEEPARRPATGGWARWLRR